MKITGTIGGNSVDLNIEYNYMDLRELFAAFALAAVVGLNLEDATHDTDANYAYAAADAMIERRG